MTQEYASINNKKRNFISINFSGHKGFFSLLFTVFAILFVVLTYTAVQQQKVYKSRASELNNNICSLATDAVCGAIGGSSSCAAISYGCCKVDGNNCIKDVDKNVKCDVLPNNICGTISNGINFSTICEWNTTDNKCVDKTTELPTGRCIDKPVTNVCADFTTEVTCNAVSTCEWKNNVCVNKTPVGNGDVELNLKLSFQGIITLPKTKTKLKIKVKIVDAVNKTKENDSSIFTADANGIWSGKVQFEDVDLNQKYYILIKGPMHVQKKICGTVAADPNPGYYSCQFGNITLKSGINTFDYSKVKMLVGDLDQNTIVNSLDTSKVLNALLLSADERQSSAVLDKADLNLDGIVSTQDWSLVLEALKIKYDEK